MDRAVFFTSIKLIISSPYTISGLFCLLAGFLFVPERLGNPYELKNNFESSYFTSLRKADSGFRGNPSVYIGTRSDGKEVLFMGLHLDPSNEEKIEYLVERNGHLIFIEWFSMCSRLKSYFSNSCYYLSKVEQEGSELIEHQESMRGLSQLSKRWGDDVIYYATFLLSFLLFGITYLDVKRARRTESKQ